MMTKPILAALGALLLLTTAPAAQSNVIPGTEVKLGILGPIANKNFFGSNGWHTGTWPNGMSALAMETTSCNLGSVNVPWLAADGNMGENHPVISFLVARERNGRLEQVSTNSWVKHGFFALSNNQCSSCQNPSNGTFLGVGCSDTYGVSNNSDHYWLGPPDEIDPWLGTWDKFCSYFDGGLNPQPGSDCDGFRSLTSSQASSLGEIGHRINVLDQDLLQSNGDMWYQGQYVVRGEPENVRENNLASKPMTPTWTGSLWNIDTSGAQVQGSILKRWDGATLRSGINGNDDGRVYGAVKVTGPVNGMYHYEYALHNRDNARGVDEFRLPVCPNAKVEGIGFRSAEGVNPWSGSVVGSEIVWSDASGANALTWNNVYNFWFDSDAAPENGDGTLGAALPGPGASSFALPSRVPTGLHNLTVGPGCSFGTVPTLVANGQATLGNAGFALQSADHEANGVVLWFLDFQSGASVPLGGGCTMYMSGALGTTMFNFVTLNADAGGFSTLPLGIPNALGLEGAAITFQTFGLKGAGGPALGLGDLSDGLQVRLGNSTSGCQ